MKIRNKFPGASLTLVTTVALLAMGHTALAQQPGGAGAQPPGAQQETEQQQQGQEQEQQEPGAGGAQAGAGELEELLQDHENLSRFLEAVRTAGMEDSLTEGGPYTIFAPTDEAFEELDVEQLLQSENWEQVAEILRAHIVADDVDPERARQLQRAQTIDGGTVEFSESAGELSVADATVVEQDFQVGNLRIYPIDRVLSGQFVERGLGGEEEGGPAQQEQDPDADQEPEAGGQQ